MTFDTKEVESFSVEIVSDFGIVILCVILEIRVSEFSRGRDDGNTKGYVRGRSKFPTDCGEFETPLRMYSRMFRVLAPCNSTLVIRLRVVVSESPWSDSAVGGSAACCGDVCRTISGGPYQEIVVKLRRPSVCRL